MGRNLFSEQPEQPKKGRNLFAAPIVEQQAYNQPLDGVSVGPVEPIDPDFAVESALRLGGATDDDLTTPKTQPAPSFEEQYRANREGVKDAALTLASGATTGAFGGFGGIVEGFIKEALSGNLGSREAAKRIEQLSMERAGQFTRQPKTEVGQDLVKSAGELMAPLAAVPPVAPQVGVIQQGLKATAPVAKQAVKSSIAQIDDAAKLVSQRMKSRQKDLFADSVGAASLTKADQRQLRADELPVKMKLTEGQKSRDFDQTRFERETAKMLDTGAPLRDRFEQQNLQLQQNVDVFIDETGGQAFSLRDIGESVDKALRSKIAKDKKRIRRLYKEAELSGGMKENVDSKPLAKYLNDNRAEREENKIMVKLQRQINAMEIGEGSFEGGDLSIRDITLKESEALRRFVNRNTDWTDANESRIAGSLKGIIDDMTEGKGNNKYKAARAARRKLGQDIENNSLMKSLTTLKRGTEERAIALEDVLRKSIISPSSPNDSVRQLRRVLQNSGEQGKQAWRDLQGGTLQHIQSEMIKNVATNQRGDRVVSAARLDKVIRDLDKSGKLDTLYGKKGAEQLRTLNDVAKTILTSPPDAVNTSNTASVLAGMMDIVVSGSQGIPLPIMTAGRVILSHVKDKKLRDRVKQALGEQ